MKCRDFCGACCIAPSISSPIPGMPQGKAANERCIQLDEHNRCKIFNDPRRPKVCGDLAPEKEMCGNCREEALAYLRRLEEATAPQ